MKSRQLEVFHAVYSKGTITEAARFLNVSQPSVSKVLAHTEAQLGFLLFSRFKGRLFPTPEAKIVYEKADNIHKELIELELLTKNISKKPSGLIRLACTPTLGLDYVPNLISSFSEEFIGVNFETHTLHYSEMLKSINEGSIDVGLAFEARSNNDIEIIKVMEGRLVVVASNKFDLPERSLNIKDLVNLPFVKVEGPLSKKLNDFFNSNKYSPVITTTTDSYYMAASFAEKGIGISILDEISAYSIASDECIWQLNGSPSCDVHLILPKNTSRSLIVNNLLKFIDSLDYNLKLKGYI